MSFSGLKSGFYLEESGFNRFKTEGLQNASIAGKNQHLFVADFFGVDSNEFLFTTIIRYRWNNPYYRIYRLACASSFIPFSLFFTFGLALFDYEFVLWICCILRVCTNPSKQNEF